MIPYLQLQAAYLIASLAITAGLWSLAGRSAWVGTSLLRRALAVAVLGALVTGIGIALLRTLDDPHGVSQFIMVAFAYYLAAFWLPLLSFAAMIRRRKLDAPLALASTALILGGLYALVIEPNRLQVVERTLHYAQWPADEPPLTIVHISDLQTVGACERERRAVELINAVAPDLVVVTGDYLAGPFWDPEPSIAAARAFLGALRPKLGIVCVSGHSESEALRRRVFEGLPIRYLRNESWELELSGGRRLELFGLTAKDGEFDKLAVRREPGLVRIGVSHVPDISSHFDGKGIDLHLAGHTHGGQICLPFIGPPVTLSRMPGEFARGMHRLGDHDIEICPGIGMEGHHAPRIRFLCPPEIDVLRIEGGGSAPLARDP